MVYAGFVSEKWQIGEKYPALKNQVGNLNKIKLMTDPLADMFNRINNAQSVSKATVDIPFSKLKYEVAKILEKENFIEKIEKPKGKISSKEEGKFLKIFLRYKDKIPTISEIKTISRPSQRIYVKSDKIKPIKGGYGVIIVSTSKGLMTGKETRKQKLGGEVICEIW